jgi:hypothetical protein
MPGYPYLTLVTIFSTSLTVSIDIHSFLSIKKVQTVILIIFNNEYGDEDYSFHTSFFNQFSIVIISLSKDDN